MRCPRCSSLKKELRDVRLPEGAVVTYGDVSARVGADGRLDPTTLRKAAAGHGSVASVIAQLANERSASGGLLAGASGPRTVGR